MIQIFINLLSDNRGWYKAKVGISSYPSGIRCSKSYIFIYHAICKRFIFKKSFSSSKSVVSYSGSDVFIFSNQIRTFYEGSKLSQMKQDIAKSRVKYGGTRFKGILPSDKTKIRKYFILSQNLMGQYYETSNSYRIVQKRT